MKLIESSNADATPYFNESEEIMFMECETFEAHIPVDYFNRLEAIAFRDGYTISWLLRTLLANPFEFEVPDGLKRPKKFSRPMHRFPICFYGEDKRLWKMKMASMESEFGAYVRHLLELYDEYLEDMDLGEGLICEAETVEKEVATLSGRISYGYQLLMVVKNPAIPKRSHARPMNNRVKMLFGRYKKRYSLTSIKALLRKRGYS